MLVQAEHLLEADLSGIIIVASFFGRINYSYSGKYLFRATIRSDGSSKFGKE